MSYFQKHLFVCTNSRDDACRKSCGDNGLGEMALNYLREEAKKRQLIGIGKLRISQSGCLGRCPSGPILVIYPEGRWYRYQNQQDLLAIVEQDLQHGRVVNDLLIDECMNG